MSTAILQNRIVRLAIETEDQTILDQVLEFFESLKSKTIPKKDWWEELTPKQIYDIEEGEAELDRGEGLPNEEVLAKINLLLGR